MTPLLLLTILWTFWSVVTGSQLQQNTTLRDLVFNVLKPGNSNNLLIGGRNFIYELSFDSLKLLSNYTTGPAEHHPNCKPAPEKCVHTRITKVDNDNKILLLKDVTNPKQFWSCGSTHQGMCMLHQLNDISKARFFGGPSNQTNFITSASNSKAFITNKSFLNETVLFIGNQFDRRHPSLSPPFISSKRLNVKNGVSFEYSYYDSRSERGTLIDILPEMKEGYPVTFVLAFSDDEFGYFLFTAPASYNSPDHETRIARICLKDKTFKSYSEMPLSCENEIGVFNFATSAYYGSSANSSSKDILHISFMSTKPKQGPKVDESKGSAICSFELRFLSDKFFQLAKECSLGEVTSAELSSFYTGQGPSNLCAIDSSFDLPSICQPSVNYYIAGIEPVVSGPIMVLQNSIITSLTTTTVQKGSPQAAVIGIVGTSSGEILKVLLTPDAVNKELKESVSKHNDSMVLFRQLITTDDKKHRDRAIRSSTAFDGDKEENLILLSDRTVFKFPVKSCSIYSTCKSCLSSIDPMNCGWCNGKCGHTKECGSTPSYSTCTPVMYDFHPKKGPAKGGTYLYIRGDNFGSLSIGNTNIKASVYVGDQPCDIVTWEMNYINCSTRSDSEAKKIRVTVLDATKSLVPYEIQGAATSDDNFEFVEPWISDIVPTFGPMNGGTNLTIMGGNLDAGFIRIINVGVQCSEATNNGTHLSCITRALQKQGKSKLFPVVITFDGHKVSSPTSKSFTYKPNPEILSMHPPGSIQKGKVPITIRGRNLDSLANPQIVVSGCGIDGLRIGDCSKPEPTHMNCTSPPLPSKLFKESGSVVRECNVMITNFGQEIRTKSQFRLKYFKNPEIYAFQPYTQPIYLEDPVIEIRGAHLHPEYYVQVTAGSDNISCTQLPKSELNKIFCRLDLKNSGKQPQEKDSLAVHYRIGETQGSLGAVMFIHRPGSSSALLIIVGVLGALVVIAVIVFCCMKKNGLIMAKKHPSFSVVYNADGHQENDYGQQGAFSAGGESTVPLMLGSVRSHFTMDDETMAILTGEHKLIAREYLSIGDVVGKGHFGCVYEGTLLASPESSETIRVAIKTLQNNAISSNRDVEMFVKEALIMKDFNHERVLNLIGVSFAVDDNLPLVIIPFMENGDLLTYIRDERNSPTVKDLITFATEIAEGMEYLSRQKCVHRDLAARNCMLDESCHVKVADFGLSRDVYEQEYYKSAKQSELPVKWMAPESLEKGSYSSKSDVWSYGVTVWEIMTRGIPPYPNVNNWEIGSYIKIGHRLPQSSCCPPELYNIMMSCWNYEPKDRPPFTDLVKSVKNVITTLENKSKSRVVSKDVTYVNYPPTATYNNEFKSEVYKNPIASQEPELVGATASEVSSWI